MASAAKAAGEEVDTVVQRVLSDQITRVRGRVPATVKLGESGTIPDEMKSALLALWVHEFLTLLPGMSALIDKPREDSFNAAITELRDLANNKINLVPPTDAATQAEQAAGPGIEVANPSRTIQRIQDSGLL